VSRSSRTASTLHTDRSGPRGERTARRVALDALRRIESDGAYANLVLGPMLATSGLSDLDRRFATELVYGTTRMRRACDSIIARFVTTPPDDATRSVLRLGTYQLVFAGVPPHAAVGETVGLAPKRTRGFVNAVLRKVSRLSIAEMSWPSDGARLSYPDWIVDRFRGELGEDAVPALERMNEAPSVTTRADGYVQDESSQWVAAAVMAGVGERVLDVCAAPGGKATAMASTGARVVAADQRIGRARLVQDNATTLGLELPVLAADGLAAPFRPGSFDAVLLDAPCSGLGALRRRADARWRIEATDVVELAELQAHLLASAAELVAPHGRLVYSVCTITAVESVDHVTPEGFEVDPTEPPVGTWRPFEQGWRVLPQDADTDGMVLIRYRRVS
jgi:16S rRNA (cytosine967-C5)-methyltransferase